MDYVRDGGTRSGDGARERGRLPTPLDVDPWWDVFLPALHRDEPQALEAGVRLLAAVPRDGWGDAAAVVARALFALGRAQEGRLMAARAWQAGGEEASRLAVLLAPDGPAQALALIRSGRARGIRADVACDLAARRAGEGDLAAAGAAIDLARAICPDHLEAAHWKRLLAGGEEAVRAVVAARRRASVAVGLWLRDADALVPLRSAGYLSEERLRRRILGVAAGGGRPGPALHRLAQAGVTQLRFGFPHQYARRSADDPAVVLELAAEHLVALHAERRDPVAAAAEVWRVAAGVEPAAEAEAARLVVAVASRDDRAVVPAVEALGALRRLEPGGALRWDAAEALVARGLAPDRTVRVARSVLRNRKVDPASARMALDALRLVGHHREALLFARRLPDSPSLRAEADAFREVELCAPPRPVLVEVLGAPTRIRAG